MRKKGSIQKFRLFVQIAFVLFIVYLSIGHYLEENYGSTLPGTASIHAVCPFGGVVSMYTFITTGDYVQKIHQSDFILIFALIIMLVLTGASFCGWICPLGSVQEWIGKIGRKVFKKRYNKVPKLLDKVLRLGKYVVLAIVIIQTARTVKLVFSDFDPYYNLFNIWTDEISLTGYLSVALVLLLSLFIERPFCRYACPLGAINGLFNSFSIFNIKRKHKTCINCGLCDKNCPAGIVVSEKNAVKSVDCIRCMKCVESCPENSMKKNTLKVRLITDLPKKNERKPISTKIFIAIIVASFLIPVAVSLVNGSFITERIKTYDSLSDIRGSSTLSEIIENYGIPKGHLYSAIALPVEISPDSKLKDLASLTGIPEEEEIVSPETIRLLLEIYPKNISDIVPYLKISDDEFKKTLAESSLSETDSVKSLISSLKPGILTYMITGKNPNYYLKESAIPDVISENEESQEDYTDHTPVSDTEIKGKTTLHEIKGMLEDYPKFLNTFSIPEDENEQTSLKDLKDKYGIEVSQIKDYMLENSK